MKVSPSQLSVFKECPQKWDYIYLQGLKPKGRKTYFDIGSYTHELLHVYYHMLQEGARPGSDIVIASINRRIQNDLANATADNVAVYNRVSKIINTFISERSPKIDRGITILVAEGMYEIPVKTPAGHDVVLHGIIDLVYRDLRGRLVVRDHKTSEKANSWSSSKVELDPQLLNYGAVYVHELNEIPIVEINFINSHEYKKPRPLTEMFDLFRIEHSETVYRRFWETTLRLIDSMIESPTIPHYSHACATCAFNAPCRLSLKGLSTEQVLANNYERVERDYTIKRLSGLSADDTGSNPQHLFSLDLSK